MGYYTYYDLEVRDLNTKELISEALEAEITRKIAVILELEENEDTTFEDLLMEELKWYDYEEDMLNLSKEYPDCVFILQGEGEDHDDNWRNYYCRGFAWGGRAEIVYPEITIDDLLTKIKRRQKETQETGT